MDQTMARMGFGLTEPDTEERMRGLAREMRGKKRLGEMFQYSADESLMGRGQQMLDEYEKSISDIGTQRSQGLTRAAQGARDQETMRKNAAGEERNVRLDARQITQDDLKAAQDKINNAQTKAEFDQAVAEFEQLKVEKQRSHDLAVEKQTVDEINIFEDNLIKEKEFDLKTTGLDMKEMQSMQDDTGKWVHYAPKKDGTGNQRITEFDGMTPEAAIAKLNPGRGFTTKPISGTDGQAKVDVITFGPNKDDLVYMGKRYTPEQWVQKEKEIVDEYQGRVTTTAGLKQFEKTWSKYNAEAAGTMLDDLNTNRGSLSKMDSTLETVISAIDAGGKTGPLWNTIPSFRNASNQLDSAISQLDLEMLNQYKLTPVSDKDLAKLVEAASPEFNNDQFRAWAVHKQEAIKRIQAINDVTEQWIIDNKGTPSPTDRRQLQMQTDQIVGDFDFAFDLDNILDYDKPIAREEGGGQQTQPGGGSPYTLQNTPVKKLASGKFVKRDAQGNLVEVNSDGSPK